MPVPDSSFSRRYGGREDSSYSSTYSSTRTSPSNRSSYLYNSKLTSTLPPRPTYDRKSSESSMPISRFLNSSTSIPRASANYITTSTSSSSRTLSPIRNSVSSYRRTFEGTPSVTDRIKSLEIGGLDKEFTNGSSVGTHTSRFLSRVREREASVKPSSTYGSSAGRDRSGSREFGTSPLLSGSSMILRDRGGSENHPKLASGDHSNNKFDLKVRAASVMGRSSSPSSSSTTSASNKRNGYSRLGSSEVTPSSSSTDTTTSTSNSSKSVPVVVATATNNAITTNNAAATASDVENSVVNLNDDDEVDGQCGRDLENDNPTPSNYPSSVILPPIAVKKQNGHESNDIVMRNDTVKTSASHTKEKSSRSSSGSGSVSPEKDSNGNTILSPIPLKEKGSSTGSTHLKLNNHKNANESGSISNSERLNTKSTAKTRRSSSSTQNQTSCTESDQKQPKVIYHSIKIEHGRDDGSESTESQQKTNTALKQNGAQNGCSENHFQNHLGNNGNILLPAPSETQVDNNKPSTNNNRNEADDEQLQLPILSKEKNQNQLESSPSSASSAAQNYINSDKVKQLIKSSSRSPSPASSSSSHLPSINNTCINFVNGESGNHVDEMAGPHGSKHLNGGHYIRPLKGSDLAQYPSSSDIMPTARGGYENSTSTTPRRHFNNSSDSSDNDSDASSPHLGGRFRSSREKEKGLSGLRNIGNTCFMNSVVQCLSNTKPLLEYLVKDNYTSDINSTTSSMHGALIRAFASVIQELWNDSKSVVDTSAFKDQIQRFAPRFMGYSQQDAQEFLRYLLEGLHEDVNRVTTKPKAITTDIEDSLSDAQKAAEAWKRYLRCDDSKIVDLFVGQLKSTLKCTTCGHCSVTFDPFWDLSLPIPSKAGQTRLFQCLELFTKEEVLDGDEKPTCAKCQTRRKCTKSFSIQKFPKVLVIHLKRFSPMERYRGKLSTTVEFPMNGLDMTPYAANRGQGCTYNLYGVSNHSGSTYSGHYIAYCKHPYSGEWYCYNDSRVSSMSTNSVVSSDGYVLFYELASQSSHL